MSLYLDLLIIFDKRESSGFLLCEHRLLSCATESSFNFLVTSLSKELLLWIFGLCWFESCFGLWFVFLNYTVLPTLLQLLDNV